MVYSLASLIFVSMILVDVVSAYVSRNQGIYLFTTPDNTNENKLKRFDADQWCKTNGTQLLEIPRNDTQDNVVRFIRDLLSSRMLSAWNTVTNAMRQGQGWKWVNDNDINSISVEQQGPDLSTSFGFLQSNGIRLLIAASLPTVTRGYICEGPSFCNNGETFSGRCYRSSTETLSWFDARNRCLDGGGDLASFDFINDSQGLLVLNGTWLSPSKVYWIGIRRLYWKWLNSNSEMKYSQWADGHPLYNPTFDCICLSPSEWKWVACDCSISYQFICLSVVAISSSTTTIARTISSSISSTTTSTTSSTTTTIMSSKSSATTRTSETAKPLSSTPSTSSSFSEIVLTPSSQSDTGSALTYDAALGIGLGVGIAGGLLISAVIVAVYIRALRRGWSGTFNIEKTSDSRESNHLQPDNSYALIPTETQSPPPAPPPPPLPP